MSYEGWGVRESGPADAERTVLLLPGGMCTQLIVELADVRADSPALS